MMLTEFVGGEGDGFKQAVGLDGAFVLYAFDVFVLNFAKSHEKSIALRLMFACWLGISRMEEGG